MNTHQNGHAQFRTNHCWQKYNSSAVSIISSRYWLFVYVPEEASSSILTVNDHIHDIVHPPAPHRLRNVHVSEYWLRSAGRHRAPPIEVIWSYGDAERRTPNARLDPRVCVCAMPLLRASPPPQSSAECMIYASILLCCEPTVGKSNCAISCNMFRSVRLHEIPPISIISQLQKSTCHPRGPIKKSPLYAHYPHHASLSWSRDHDARERNIIFCAVVKNWKACVNAEHAHAGVTCMHARTAHSLVLIAGGVSWLMRVCCVRQRHDKRLFMYHSNHPPQPPFHTRSGSRFNSYIRLNELALLIPTGAARDYAFLGAAALELRVCRFYVFPLFK